MQRNRAAVGAWVILTALPGWSQIQQGGIPAGGPPAGGPPMVFVGAGGPPPFGQGTRKILKDFDQDQNGRLNREERAAARESLAKDGQQRAQFRPPFMRPSTVAPKPGAKLTQKDVKKYGTEPLYDPMTVRTLFLQFENDDWEKELAAFRGTDVEEPATLTVDGKEYPEVGVHFRGASSYMMVGEGWKRSLNVSLDFADKKQRLLGYRTLNLLNSHEDPTFLRTVLYLQIARQYIPAPKANYARVVINGENWGIYVNAEQFNADFLKEWFGTTDGARWKVPGSPMGRGGLAYLGEDPAAYNKIYEIKSKDKPESWKALIQLTKVLSETEPAQMEEALEPILNVDGVLKFLALEKALINSDGYWTRASDYSLYLDTKGQFHVIPHDANETLAPAMQFGPGFGFRVGGPPPAAGAASGEGGPRGPGGPGGFGGPGGPGGPRGTPPPPSLEIEPMAGEKDPSKVLLSKMLASPELRSRYLTYVRDIAREWLDWQKIEPLARKYQSLIAADIAADGRKLESTEAFSKAVDQETTSEGGGPFGGRTKMSLKDFVEKRRAYLLNHPDIKALDVKAADKAAR